MDRITVRRRQHRHLTEMQPLQFKSDTADLNCEVVSLFDDFDRSVVLTFVTAIGSIHVRMPSDLASDLASGLADLTRHHRRLQTGDMSDAS
jgi:hypothetical protein